MQYKQVKLKHEKYYTNNIRDIPPTSSDFLNGQIQPAQAFISNFSFIKDEKEHAISYANPSQKLKKFITKQNYSNLKQK